MVRRELFEQLGGYDEQFAVGFNDADFCLRAWEAGFKTVFSPYAELYHYEFTSRGRESGPEKVVALEARTSIVYAAMAELFPARRPLHRQRTQQG